MPPVTPRTIRRPASTGRRLSRPSRLGGVGAPRPPRPRRSPRATGPRRPTILSAADLLEGDRQRLAGHRGDLRRHDRAEAVAELAEVGVDLAGPAGTQRDQAELRVRRGRGAPRSAGSSSCRAARPWVSRCSRGGIERQATAAPRERLRIADCRAASMTWWSSATARSRSSLTTVTAPSSAAESRSSAALARRWRDLLLGVAPARGGGAPAPPATGRRRRSAPRRGTALDLAWPLDVDLEHDVGARRRVGQRRALAVVEELDPLEEPAGVDQRPRTRSSVTKW